MKADLSVSYDNALKSNSTFLKVADGETVTAKVLSLNVEKIPGFQGGEGKMGVALRLETEFGEKKWESSARNVIEQMRDNHVSVNDTLEISRTGEGTNTKYKILVVS